MAPNVKQVVGVDIASDMISIFDHKRTTAGPANATGYLINIFEDTDLATAAKEGTVPGGLDDFDAAVASLAYHHIDDTAFATSAIYARIKTGGWAISVDLAKDVKPVHAEAAAARLESIDREIVPHPTGFTCSDLEVLFTGAGFKHVQSDSFTADLWADAKYIDRFGKHHIVSRDDDGDDLAQNEERSGLRIYETKTVKGANGEDETRYLIRKKLNMVAGQRL